MTSANQRSLRGFRFPYDKYEDEVALYTNFRYLQEYLRRIAFENFSYASATVAASDSVNKNADYVCDGSNDTAVIQQAIDDVEADGGGYILFYDGTFTISSLTITKNMLFRGYGAGSTVFVRKAGSSGAMIIAGGAFTMTEIALDGQNIASTTGVNHDDGSLQVYRCLFVDWPQYCIDHELSAVGNFCFIDFNVFTNDSATTGTAAIRIAGSDQNVVSGNLFKNYTDGILYSGSTQGLVVGNIAENSASNHVDYMVNATNSSSNIGVYNNFNLGGIAIARGSGYIAAHNDGVGHAGGVIDHGGLGGLSDDDHTQYLKEKASGGTASEVPTHTHADAANAGTIDHGGLTGLGDDDHTQYTRKDTLTTKGDVYVASGASTPARLAVGANDTILTADSAEVTGLKWAAAPPSTDDDAIHDNVAGEINALTAPTLATADVVLIEDADDSFNKKKTTVGDIQAAATDHGGLTGLADDDHSFYPKGILDHDKITANQTGITTETDITGMTHTFTAVAGRLYRVMLNVRLQQLSSAGRVVIRITDGSNNSLAASAINLGSGTEDIGTLIYLNEPGAGSVTWKARASTDAGTLSVLGAAGAPSWFVVEDVGLAP